MINWTRNKFVFLLSCVLLAGGITLLLSCAGGAGKASPARGALPTGVDRLLLRTVHAYEAGRHDEAIALADSLLGSISPADSQLAFLGVYYGLRARIATDADSASVAQFLRPNLQRAPAQQRSELRYVFRGPAADEPSRPEEGPATAWKIGVVLPLSGKFYEFGEAVLEGVRLAVDEFNEGNHGGRPLELVVHDDGGEPVRAASLGRRLAADSTVLALVGSHGNEATLSLALAASTRDLTLVCPTADAPGLEGVGRTVHVLNPTDPQLSAAVADAAVDRIGLQTFAVVAEDDERGELLAAGFVKQVRSDGGAVVADLRFPAGTSNFEDQMALIQRYLPDAIYITAKSDMITQLASQVHYYGMGNVQLLGGEYWDSDRVIRLGGEYVEGGVFASPFYSESDSLRWLQFEERYESVYRRPVNRFSAYGYDAAGLVINALDELPARRSGLTGEIRRAGAYHGATGIYSVGEDGRVQRHYFVLRLVSGRIVPVRSDITAAPADTNSSGGGQPIPPPGGSN